MLTNLKRRFSLKSYSTRLYACMLLLVTVLAVAVGFSQGEMVYQVLIENKEQDLKRLAKHMADQVPVLYEENLAGKGQGEVTKNELISSIKKELQNHLATRPDVGMCYNDMRLNSSVTAGSSLSENCYNEIFLNNQRLEQIQSGKVGIFKNPISIGHGEPVLGVFYPVKKDGKIIGHTCVYEKVEDIVAVASHIRKDWLFASMSIFAVGLAGVQIISYRSKKALHEFADCMKNMHPNDELTYTIEELTPLIEEAKASQRQQLSMALQNERLATIGQLAAGLAHDIRNPLTSIRGFLQLMSAKVAENDKELINISIEELDSINHLIRDMLFLARPPESNLDRVNPGSLLASIKGFVTPEANLHEVVLKTQIQPDLPEVLIDPDQIRQVLINLIRNAFEAIKSNGEILLIAYGGENYVNIEIKDNGSGISEEDQGKVYDALYTTKNNGTGLGLAICREIIANHNGKISFVSKVGQGTTFKIQLPYKGKAIGENIADSFLQKDEMIGSKNTVKPVELVL